MERVQVLAAAFPLVWITMVACGKEGGPVQPTPARPPATPVETLPIARPSQPMPDARSLTAGVLVEEDFSNLGIEDTSCPGTSLDFLHVPCLHFNFVAPSTGILRVSVTWDGKRTEAVGLIAGEIEADPGWMSGTGYYHYANPKVVRARVGAGENYRLTAFLVTSHLDYLGWLAGPFQLTATIE